MPGRPGASDSAYGFSERGLVVNLGRQFGYCLLLVTMQAFAGPFEDGVAAYDRGQFAAALKLWLPLAQQGDAAAQFNVGVLYEKGAGVAQDYAEAARWYLKAARQGDPDAQYDVAVMYERGTGVAQDLETARKWYGMVIANPQTGGASLATKERARQRLAKLSPATEEAVPFQGGRFVFERAPDGTCIIALQGLIDSDTSSKFDAVTTKSASLGCAKPWLLLESGGGSLLDGLSLGKEVRMQGFRTIARYECASACAMIFIGGTERVLAGSRAKIGLHQPASVREVGNSNSRWCGNSFDSNGVREIKGYLLWAIPAEAEQVMDIIMRTSCNAVEWISGRRAIELGIATKIESEGIDVFGPPTARR